MAARPACSSACRSTRCCGTDARTLWQQTGRIRPGIQVHAQHNVLNVGRRKGGLNRSRPRTRPSAPPTPGPTLPLLPHDRARAAPGLQGAELVGLPSTAAAAGGACVSRPPLPSSSKPRSSDVFTESSRELLVPSALAQHALLCVSGAPSNMSCIQACPQHCCPIWQAHTFRMRRGRRQRLELAGLCSADADAEAPAAALLAPSRLLAYAPGSSPLEPTPP